MTGLAESPLLRRVALEWGLITPVQAEECLREQAEAEGRGEPVRFEQILLRRQWIDTNALTRLLRETDLRASGAPSLRRYEILERIGEGGMAVVYRARDRELDRTVALKVLKESAATDESVRVRFRREALAAARLGHPNLVTVHDAGEQEGRLFLVMEFVRGEPLDRVLVRKSHELSWALRLLEKVARAVHHAHGHGIVHRDLKPGNILVTAEGEPKVVDFGLAFLQEGGSALTKTGTAVGTPMYMAPEQIVGRGRQVTAQTDVYALGAILYEAAAGRPPHIGGATIEIYAKVVGEDPLEPRLLNPRIPPEAEAVILKAIEKVPLRRYETAEALADDLRRVASGEPVRAAPVSRWRRLRRRMRRHRSVLLPAAAAAALGLWVGIGFLVDSVRSSGRIRTALAEAAKREQAGELGEALAFYREVLTLDPVHAEASEGYRRTSAEVKNRGRQAAVQQQVLRLLEQARPVLDEAFRSQYRAEADPRDMRNRAAEGRRRIEEALQLAPDLAVAHDLLARAWEIEGSPDRAEACWRRAIELDPHLGSAHFHLGRLLVTRAFLSALGTGEKEMESNRSEVQRLAEEAVGAMERAMERGGVFDDELRRKVAEAMLAYARRDGSTALEITGESILRFRGKEGEEEFHWLRGMVVPGTGEKRACYDRAIERRPHFALARFSRGMLRHLQGDPAGAIADYDAALAVWPRFGDAFLNRGVSHFVRGDLDRAIADFDEAVSLNPGSAGVRYNRGNAKRRKGDLAGAVADFDEAIRLRPDMTDAWINRGIARLHQGEVLGAIGDYDEALRLDPEAVEAYVDRANARKRLGDLQGALSDYDAALQRNPRLVQAYVNRGTLKHALKDLDGALRDFEEALRLDPREAGACVNRGILRLEKRDVRGAIEDFTQALEFQPDQYEAYLNRGVARHRIDPRAALADYDAAVRLQPNSVEGLFNRGLLRRTLDDREGAAEDFRRALQVAPPDWSSRKIAEQHLRELE